MFSYNLESNNAGYLNHHHSRHHLNSNSNSNNNNNNNNNNSIAISNNNKAHLQEQKQRQSQEHEQNPRNPQVYQNYHFIQQQQHFQYLQNALANTMSQLQHHPPYHGHAVFKPNYMQDVFLNDSCSLGSPVNSIENSGCTTTKTTPIISPMSLNDNVLPPPNHHDFDTFMGNNFVDYTSSYNPEHTLPSPSSPLTMVCNDGRRHDDHMNFASTFSVHPASSKCAIQHYGNSNQELTKGYPNPNSLVYNTTNNCINNNSNSNNNKYSSHEYKDTRMMEMATPESPHKRNSLPNTRVPIIPTSPTFPIALNLIHSNANTKRHKSLGSATSMLQPPLEDSRLMNSGHAEPMKKRLLSRFSSRLIQKLRLAESDMKCRKHCNTRFGNYLELIDHFEGHGLQRYLSSRTFICPVKECPMNMIGFDKRAELRHHVHSDHVTHGLVSIQYAKYSEEIKEFLFVCDEENCGKGFYRSDTLTRHIKLVHKREKHFTKRKRRQVVAHQEDKAIKKSKG
ncbi:zinc finger protein RME1 [Candida albicans L26]|uniref:Rme1p n=2 Tax=Candida albicans TaxID=5476 RepID=Q59WD1_CANAL|nr:Rme1p [Candida albicans SC5314]KGQ99105.1 zinc finger protein RME1 [Candida albicans P37005]KGR21741.1 zinc finger protein RME1 [Candida albicans P78048]KGR23768.1 zinc finger protein RME1 [Candida albicans P37037]KGT72168.1 zinc finger protein RME1 [Candida albicans 12C]KGU15052.1 zinc finger protein RME1 [Candida albicans P87]KGU17461.1 zinc finger protein RME1 [Candida albicans 19F]KGU18962.1 zinc finger protein RME1 [Candida albicans L26]KGU34087.1 zinc finger protein RME1 [Candida a|eukprot:XP_713882.1 Rme1p [Candida albicans SC5314]